METQREKHLIGKPSLVLCVKFKKGVTTKAPKQVLHKIENSVGGVINAQAGCDLPCNI